MYKTLHLLDLCANDNINIVYVKFFYNIYSVGVVDNVLLGSILNPISTQLVPIMSPLRTRIDDNITEKIKSLQPSHLSRQAFINELILLGIIQKYKQKNDMALYINKDRELVKHEIDNKEEKEKINKKEKEEKIVPDDLKNLETQIIDFWKVKKGSKSLQAWKQQITEYRKFIQKYGEQVLKDQLEQGILDGTWKGLKVSNYEHILRITKAKAATSGFVEENKPHPNQKLAKFDEYGRLI